MRVWNPGPVSIVVVVTLLVAMLAERLPGQAPLPQPASPYASSTETKPEPAGAYSNKPSAKTYVNPFAQVETAEHSKHIDAAVQHLQAAGLPELAARVRQASVKFQKKQLLAKKLKQLAKLQAEIASLQKDTGVAGQQIVLQLSIMEAASKKLREKGISLIQSNQNLASHLLPSPQPEGALKVSVQPLDQRLTSVIDELRNEKALKILAEPTLVTISGKPVSFESLGEFPIVVPQSPGKVAVEYRSFGTRVKCLPVLLPGGKLRLEIRPEFSEIDPTNSVTLNDTQIPGLRTRWLDTAIEVLPDTTTLLVAYPSAEDKESAKAMMIAVKTALVSEPPAKRRVAVRADASSYE